MVLATKTHLKSPINDHLAWRVTRVTQARRVGNRPDGGHGSPQRCSLAPKSGGSGWMLWLVIHIYIYIMVG